MTGAIGVVSKQPLSRISFPVNRRRSALGGRLPAISAIVQKRTIWTIILGEAVLRVVEERVRFPALDGHELGGIFYSAEGLDDPARVIVFSTGGGVAAVRYRRFARFLALSGVPVFTYDYRGIGESRPASLRGFSAVLEDWSEFDCGGAIAWLRARYLNAELIGVAHSVGTLIFGGAANAREVTRFVMICPHTGYYGDYRRLYRLPMAALWHGVLPVLTRRVGYFPARRLGLGDDIPAGIALQWAARKTPDLKPEATDPSGARGRTLIARCAALEGPALLITFSDDAFATDAGARRMLSYFPSLSPTRWVIAPADVGLVRLGHFGFFRQGPQSPLWERLLAHIVPAKVPKRLGAAYRLGERGKRAASEGRSSRWHEP